MISPAQFTIYATAYPSVFGGQANIDYYTAQFQRLFLDNDGPVRRDQVLMILGRYAGNKFLLSMDLCQLLGLPLDELHDDIVFGDHKDKVVVYCEAVYDGPPPDNPVTVGDLFRHYCRVQG